MVKLDPKPEAPPRKVEDYRSRRAKLRLMVIVFSLMFVVVMISEAFKPESWVWLTGSSPKAVAVEEDIDTRLKPNANPLPLGVFVSEPAPDTEDESAGQSPLGLNLARYRAIKDNTVFRSKEMSIWYDTFGAIRDLTVEDSNRLKGESTSFTQLYRQSDQYRGQLVQVAGTVRRVDYHKAHSNEQGIPGYFQFWLWPENSINPIVVYRLDLPDGFPVGEDVNEYVAFDGVFFKRWAYEAKGGFMTAPVVLAHGVNWTQKIASAPTPLPSLQTAIAGLCGFALLSSLIAYGVYRVSVRPNKKVEHYREQESLAQISIGELAEHDIPTEDELVRRELARREEG